MKNLKQLTAAALRGVARRLDPEVLAPGLPQQFKGKTYQVTPLYASTVIPKGASAQVESYLKRELIGGLLSDAQGAIVFKNGNEDDALQSVEARIVILTFDK